MPEMLAWMFAGHLAGDYLLQIGWMAQNKHRNILALLLHAAVYTLSVFCFAIPAGGLNWYSALFVFISHIIIDQRGFVNFWCRFITKTTDIQWLVIVTDQSWHAVSLAVACLLTSL